MACDYLAIRADNKVRYGTDIGRIGPNLLANRYDDRTHFIFELLQNAEDALARRVGWRGSRAVAFHLRESVLRISHCGLPFDENDVRGICGIAQSTKGLTAIGRFGIGFKSVYAFTDRPEIHSGAEAFAIESFVWPVATSDIKHDPDETIISIPLRATDDSGHDEIARALGRLGATALLFLQQIEEIRWSVEGGRSGFYLREARKIGAGVRRVTVIGHEQEHSDVDEEWLVFSRSLPEEASQHSGQVELAFSIARNDASHRESIQRVERSPLVVFFPTVLETHLGFLIQGPYRTTPSRDNVPQQDPWNIKLVQASAALLVESLEALKAEDLLDVAALESLPLARSKYPQSSMFAPLFDAVLRALSSGPLLPRAGGGFTAAKHARLAKTQELRALFDSKQLAALLNAPEEVCWLSGDITRDTAASLRNYLINELKVTELTPESALPGLTRKFLESQPDDWILRLYEFLEGQSALMRQPRVSNIPLVRLEDGTHVSAHSGGQPEAFLPSAIKTDFPTVKKSVCATAKSLEFLKGLGLTEPDAVDDVLRNIVPKYKGETSEVDDGEYESDIKRILNAFDTQHRGQRNRLIAALAEASFVMSVDAGDGSQYASKPDDVYLATERLKELFAGVPGVMLVDDSYSCLKGEGVRDLLEACGAVRYLRPLSDSTLSWDERSALRVTAGHADTSGQNDRVTNWSLLGLDALLEALPKVAAEARRTRARLIWDELVNLEERRGKGMFTGEYTWTHYGSYRTAFDAAFVRKLNESAWVPDQHGELQQPRLVLFDTLSWLENPFLLSKIHFKPPVLDQLAREAGIEPGVLDLLRTLGVTSEAELRERLGVRDDATDERSESEDDVKHALGKLLDGSAGPTPLLRYPAGSEPVVSGNRGGRGGEGKDTRSASEQTTGSGSRGDGSSKDIGAGNRAAGNSRTPARAGDRKFISYVAAHPEDEEPDPDGLDHSARMAIEAKAIELILSSEPDWRRTPAYNPGFDLYQGNEHGGATHWCEVKAMTGRLADRPVGLSHTQFEWAREHGEAYWLYVVECAGTDEARLVRIQNPAGKARTFTFDHGWLDIAETDSEEEPRED